MTWQQPVPRPDGAFLLTTMNHPCVNGCAGWFKLPAAERGTVVAPEATPGNVAVANQEHRTEWHRSAPPPDDDHAAGPPV